MKKYIVYYWDDEIAIIPATSVYEAYEKAERIVIGLFGEYDSDELFVKVKKPLAFRLRP